MTEGPILSALATLDPIASTFDVFLPAQCKGVRTTLTFCRLH